jgi:hypothetical protein
MAEARSNESLKITSENEFTEKEAAEQLIQLSEEVRISSSKRNMITLEKGLELVDEAITNIESHQPENHQYEMKKFRSLGVVYMETAPKCSRNRINRKRKMTTLEEEKADQGVISKAITKIESSQAKNHQEMKKFRPLKDIHKVTKRISVKRDKGTKTLNQGR